MCVSTCTRAPREYYSRRPPESPPPPMDGWQLALNHHQCPTIIRFPCVSRRSTRFSHGSHLRSSRSKFWQNAVGQSTRIESRRHRYKVESISTKRLNIAIGRADEDVRLSTDYWWQKASVYIRPMTAGNERFAFLARRTEVGGVRRWPETSGLGNQTNAWRRILISTSNKWMTMNETMSSRPPSSITSIWVIREEETRPMCRSCREFVDNESPVFFFFFWRKETDCADLLAVSAIDW